MANAKVFFVTRSQRFNTKPAERFGAVVFLMEDDVVSPFQTDRIMRLVEERLVAENFDCERDFIALTGGHVFVAMFLTAAVSKYGSVRALLFDARSSRYQERIISVTRDAPTSEVQ